MNVKTAIKDLVPYKPNYEVVPIKLDANEGQNYLFPNGVSLKPQFERYPSSNSDNLRELLAQEYSLSIDNFIVGNGSTELLEIAVKTYCNPGDTILSIEPSFSMYSIYATIHGVQFIPVEGNNQEIQTVDSLIESAQKYNPKIIFLCNPNNPTGSIIKNEDIIRVLESTEALVIVDEAYMEFFIEGITMASEINKYNNLIVARTFSKAYGLAYARVGYMISNIDIIDQLLCVKLPYNVNGISTEIAALAFQKQSDMKLYVKGVSERRELLYRNLINLGISVQKSKANFLYITLPKNINKELIQKGILIRSFGKNNYRVTIGLEEENNAFLEALKEILL